MNRASWQDVWGRVVGYVPQVQGGFGLPLEELVELASDCWSPDKAPNLNGPQVYDRDSRSIVTCRNLHIVTNIYLTVKSGY